MLVLLYITDIKMPPIIRKRGRPKGHEVTVRGLSAKKKRKKKLTDTPLQPFIKLHTSIKEKGIHNNHQVLQIIVMSVTLAMLRWFVDNEIMKAAIKNSKTFLIEELSVEARPEKIPDAVLDENVDIHIIRKYFTQDAWLLLEDVVQQKQKSQSFICRSCCL